MVCSLKEVALLFGITNTKYLADRLFYQRKSFARNKHASMPRKTGLTFVQLRQKCDRVSEMQETLVAARNKNSDLPRRNTMKWSPLDKFVQLWLPTSGRGSRIPLHSKKLFSLQFCAASANCFLRTCWYFC